jgi:hypothetical protein
MKFTRIATLAVVSSLGWSAASAAPAVTLRMNPQRIVGGAVSVIAIRVTDSGKPLPNVTVRIAVVEGHECGTRSHAQVTTADDGTASAELTGTQHVEDCQARLEAAAEIPALEDTGSPHIVRAQTTVTVNPASTIPARIDGLSAIALVLIVSFAIDRLVRGLLFLLSYWGFWARQFPDPTLVGGRTSPKKERNRKLVYFLLAGSLGVIALGWAGGVRILAAIGFTNVHPWLDILVTGLILAGGADRMDHLLRAVGGSGSTPDPVPAAPLEITGRLTIDDQGNRLLEVRPNKEPNTPPVGGRDDVVGVLR